MKSKTKKLLNEKKAELAKVEKELYNISKARHECTIIQKQSKQFNLNTYWKKTLAVIGIGVMVYVGILMGASLLTSILTLALTKAILLDPVAAIVQALLSGGIVYFCYRGIARLSRDLANSKKLRGKKR